MFPLTSEKYSLQQQLGHPECWGRQESPTGVCIRTGVCMQECRWYPSEIMFHSDPRILWCAARLLRYSLRNATHSETQATRCSLAARHRGMGPVRRLPLRSAVAAGFKSQHCQHYSWVMQAQNFVARCDDRFKSHCRNYRWEDASNLVCIEAPGLQSA